MSVHILKYTVSSIRYHNRYMGNNFTLIGLCAVISSEVELQAKFASLGKAWNIVMSNERKIYIKH